MTVLGGCRAGAAATELVVEPGHQDCTWGETRFRVHSPACLFTVQTGLSYPGEQGHIVPLGYRPAPPGSQGALWCVHSFCTMTPSGPSETLMRGGHGTDPAVYTSAAVCCRTAPSSKEGFSANLPTCEVVSYLEGQP